MDLIAGRETSELVRWLYRGVLRRDPSEEEVAHWVATAGTGAKPSDIARSFANCPEAAQAPLFVPPGHYYSPITPVSEVDGHLKKIEARAVPESVSGVTIDRTKMVALWKELVPLMASAPFQAERTAGLRYWFDNPAYSWGDGSVLHAVLRLFRPRRLIEIGSGWSSACTLDTVGRYLNGDCAITFIDPYPKSLEDLVGTFGSGAGMISTSVQEVAPTVFDQLEAGDVLFIDSTHVLRTGSDVCYELFDILPRLAPGVLVHIHDMFWPFEYPREWAVNENRSWNEIYGVRAFLTGSPEWRILMFNDFLFKLERALIEATYPAFLRNPGGALWLQRLAS